MTKLKKTNEQFIKEASIKHNNYYNYSKTVYKNKKTKITIVCPIHGEFVQAPYSHLHGARCPRCSVLKRSSNNENFIKNAQKIHNNRYDYSKVIYVNAYSKIKIICEDHGVFQQVPTSHLSGNGCPLCGVDKRSFNTSTFQNKARVIHNNKYDYSLTNYKNSKEKITIICPIHGEFDQYPSFHLTGGGCRKCAMVNATHSISSFIEKSNNIHNNKYDYTATNYVHSSVNVKIGCPVHGEFDQLASLHLAGNGCSKCAIDGNTYNTAEFIDRAIKTHGMKYNYSLVNYINCFKKVKIICQTHGEFEQTPDSHVRGAGCRQCACNGSSRGQTEIYEFIKTLIDNVTENDRTVIAPYELDIVSPENLLAVEYNGIYWHNDQFKNKESHYEKFKLTIQAGYKLITIFEDEWIDKPTIVKKLLTHRLGLSNRGLTARKLQLKEIDNKIMKEFLEREHIQGAPHSTTVSLGAFDEETLVAVMTFGHPTRQKSAEWELSRFATDGKSHAGIANRLFKYFINNYNPTEIVSFSDNRWFEGGIYEKLGFKLDKDLPVDYSYVKGQKRYHKSNFRKEFITKRFDYVFAEGETEWNAMQNLGYLRIWDCGKKRWLWKV